VLIHDGVRPFPPAQPVHEALAALASFDGAVLGEPSTDTLKRVDAQGLILGTEPRDGIFRAQTPQVARLSLWREAFRWAAETGFQGTDDVSLLEAMGLRVKLVPAPPSNLKVTTPDDWDRWHPGATGCGGSAHTGEPATKA
jgi:2-C-methyl-D-erythritol 4-phosphate cytidylyltransferase